MKRLIAGMTIAASLLIATPAFAYTVKSGDTMSAIANENSTSLQALSKANPQIKNLDLIYVGQHINTLPGEAPVISEPKQTVSDEGFQSFVSTAYSMGTTTASGTTVHQGRTIAVDPKVIPLGTKVELKFPLEYSYLNGIYTAEDTGSAIKGKKIDLYLNSESICIKFGVKEIQLKIIK